MALRLLEFPGFLWRWPVATIHKRDGIRSKPDVAKFDAALDFRCRAWRRVADVRECRRIDDHCQVDHPALERRQRYAERRARRLRQSLCFTSRNVPNLHLLRLTHVREEMKGDVLLAQPLTEAEIEQLDDFLISDSVPEEAMDVSMMDGFITALASGPNLMLPSSMLRWIFDAEHGEESPTFANAEESTIIARLIIRHWNDVNDTPNDALDDYEPLILEREAEGGLIAIIDEWCIGYYKGISVDHAAWAPLMAQHPEWFTAIMLYGTEDGWEELKRRQDNLDQHQAFADSLATSVRNIHRYWVEQRRRQIARGEMPGVIGRREPLRRAPKIGRNDPCPCGSGKKYKRCHGTAESTPEAANENGRLDWTLAESTAMDAEPYPVHSPLSQRVARDGAAVEIEIYEDGEGGWLLEIVDEFGNSTVWDDAFPTDSAALAEALSTIETEGIASLIGSAAAGTTPPSPI